MEPETNKKALSKEETKGLLSLIEGSNIITNKKTNAGGVGFFVGDNIAPLNTNKMKMQEWIRIADRFNATIGIYHRTPQQLRLKWENLKKNSRKRSTLIRMERMNTGGRPPGYFPPDDMLDRVAALLTTTGEGLTVMFDGDAEPQSIGGGGDVGSGGVGGGGESDTQIMPLYNITSPTPMVIDNSLKVPVDELNLSSTISSTPIVPRQKRHFRASGVKHKLMKPDDGRQARNIALAEYYNVKKKILELKFENIVLGNEKLKLEIKKLKGEDP